MPIDPSGRKDRKTVAKSEDVGKTTPSAKPSKKLSKNYTTAILICVVVAVAGLLLVVVNMNSSSKVDDGQEPTVESKNVASGEEGSDVTVNTPTETESTGKKTDQQIGAEKPWLHGSTEVEPMTEDPSKTITKGEDGVGIKDISGDTVKSNDTKVSPDTFVKDLKGASVSANYDIKSIGSVVDFISYKKKRAITGKGVELYWLEANYKGVPAKVQVSFAIFKELDEQGITVVDVEIVELDTGDGEVHQIATNFTVRPDYKEILEKN